MGLQLQQPSTPPQSAVQGHCTAAQVFILGLSVFLLPCTAQAELSSALDCPHAWGCPMPPGWELPQTFLRVRTGRWEGEPIPPYRPPQLHHLGKKCGELQRHDRAALGRTSTAELLLLIRHPELSHSSGEPFTEQRSPCQEHPRR